MAKTAPTARFKRRARGRKNRFEGWYLRIIDAKKAVNLAFIMAETTAVDDAHAFIQVFDGTAGKNHYTRFDRSAYSFQDDTLTIATNRLSLDGAHFDVAGHRVDVSFSDMKTIAGKSAMGFLSSLPLECYQEVVMMDARVEGNIVMDDKTIAISGKAYIEKTYGRRFPKSWFWLQANHFKNDVRLSVAGGRVPTLFFRPFGFFAICQVGADEYVFSTPRYSRAHIRRKNEQEMFFLFKHRDMTLNIHVVMGPETILVGPASKGRMTLDVPESLTSNVTIALKKKGVVVLEDQSDYAGSEWMFD